MDLAEVAKKHNVSLVVLFGSKVKGNAHKHSDTDVAFLALNNMTLEDELQLTADIGKVLKTNIDPVNINRASPLILYHVFKYGKPLYEKEEGLFSEYLAKSMRLYEETMPLYEARLALL